LVALKTFNTGFEGFEGLPKRPFSALSAQALVKFRMSGMEPPPRWPGFVRPEKTGSPQSQEEPTIVCACACTAYVGCCHYPEGSEGAN
jgi:hypothetical protein